MRYLRILAGILAGFLPAVAQGTAESDAVLAKAREKILAVAQRLPRYTCLETINREYFDVPAVPVRGKVLSAYAAPACSARVDRSSGNQILASSDRLRLEVAVSGHREIESWPGATQFDSRTIDEIVKSGPTSTGSFGTYLIELFDNPGAKIDFTGEKTEGGRRILAYQFRIPHESSHYRIQVAGNWQYTASSGTFEVAAATADLTRFIIETDPSPAGAQMCQAKTTIDYHQIRIGEGDFLLPLTSELDTIQLDSSRTRSVSTFSACHEYSAESTLRFDDDEATAQHADAAKAAAAALPAGLTLTVKLSAPIDTKTAAAGDVVPATVSKAVVSPGTKTILIPSGARVKGRISEMHQFLGASPHLQIGVVFDTLQLRGVDTPVTLALEAAQQNPAINPSGTRERTYGSGALRMRPVDLNIAPANANGDGGFFVFLTALPYVVPAGYESKWTTRRANPEARPR